MVYQILCMYGNNYWLHLTIKDRGVVGLMILTNNPVIFQFIVKRMGRWIDFDNDYKTLYPWFMESVWYVRLTLI